MPYTQGTRVEITPGKYGRGGMSEFHGKRGTVIGYEKDGRTTLHRVKLDEPVFIKGIGMVTDDLWAGEYLQDLDDV